MLLLYPYWNVKIIIILTIYIPLCFYFIKRRHRNLWKFLNLHSTMLLLYPGNALDSVKDFLFTFHYASTLSVFPLNSPSCFPYLHSTMLLLYLFHCWQLHDVRGNLHSTMLLLYHQSASVQPEKGSDLHSTMLLLYQTLLKIIGVGDQHLHSTMLLLYQMRIWIWAI